MPIIRRADEADLSFRVQDFDGELRVVSVRGSEGISKPYHFYIELASEDAEVDFDSVLYKSALLTIRGEQGERQVHGMICAFEQAEEREHYTSYHAELVPVIWLLQLRQNCRIFQNKTIKDILSQVLDEAGLSSELYRFALGSPGATWEYCVQYRESDFQFISRLMEHEGIFYFFEHDPDKHVLVMADGPSVHKPLENKDAFLYRPPTGEVQSEEHVYQFKYGEEIRPGAVVLRDFNHENPALNLEVVSQGQKDLTLERSEWPGKYQDASLGQTLSRIRLEAEQVPRMTAGGLATSRGFLPGFLFTLDEHPRSSLNQQYLITSIDHSASQPQSLSEEGTQSGENAPHYQCTFRSIPASVPFRPVRETPWPRIRGPQTALVVGPSGEQIYTDDQGRVKVQFHWDRTGELNEKSSCWIRVSQGWAGGKYGSFFLPRIGQEVVVDFLDGDPDRPLVTGRVFNGDHPPPYKLPDHKTRSVIKTKSNNGDGTNEIRLEDKSGSEQFYIHAQKDMDVRVLNNLKETIDNERHLLVKEACKIKLGSSDETAGEKAVKISGQRSLTVQKDVLEDVKGNHKETVGNEYNLKAQKIIIEGDTEVTLRGAGGFIKLDSSGVTISGTMVLINSGGAPGVAAVTASAASPGAPEEAEKTTCGRDTVYTPVAQIKAEAVAPAPVQWEEEAEEEAPPRDSAETKLVDGFFQKCPGFGGGDGRGIGGLEYRVLSGGSVVQTGKTSEDGKVTVSVSDGPSELQILWEGKAVASYLIQTRDEEWEPNNSVIGVQRRLRTLGYQLGHSGEGNDGIDGVIGGKTDKAIQDFQIDSGLLFDGLVGPETRSKLDQEVGGSV